VFEASELVSFEVEVVSLSCVIRVKASVELCEPNSSAVNVRRGILGLPREHQFFISFEGEGLDVDFEVVGVLFRFDVHPAY